jgi:predicted permease
MESVVLSIVKLFLMLAVGFVARKLSVMDKATTKGLSSLLIKVTLPALIFTSMQRSYTPQLFSESLTVLGISAGVYAMYFVVALIVGKTFRAPDRDKGVYQFVVLFSNVAFMGFPVLASVFGNDSIFFAAMFNIPFHFLVFTVGVVMMTRGHESGKSLSPALFLSSGVLMTLAGFLFFLFQIPVWAPLFDTLKLVGDLTIPLSLITVGSILTEVSPKEVLSGWRIYVLTALRLLILPAIVYAVLRPFVSGGYLLYVPVVLAAMPAAVNAPLIAQEYGGNEILASKILFVSTSLSLVTVPLVLIFLSSH